MPVVCNMEHGDERTYLQSETDWQRNVRVGPQYQVSSIALPVGSLSPVADTECHGTLLYSAKCIKSHTLLNAFLTTVRSYFMLAPHLYDEAAILHLLHQYQYNMADCLEALEPIDEMDHIAAEDDSDSSDESVAGAENGNDNSDDVCAVCGEGGQLLICEYRNCNRVYHFQCVGLTDEPQGEWYCSAHFCTVCHAKVPSDSQYVCSNCPTAYCQYHIPRAVHDVNVLNTAANHNNIDVDDKQEFLCTRCRTQDDASTIQQERHTFLTQLQSMLMQPTHPHLLRLFHEIQQRGGIQEVLAGTQWKSVGKLLNTLIHSTTAHTTDATNHTTLVADNTVPLTPSTAD